MISDDIATALLSVATLAILAATIRTGRSGVPRSDLILAATVAALAMWRLLGLWEVAS